MLKNQKKSRVVCTIGPASSSDEVIRQFIESGMNVARLNFSHGTYDSHREIIRKVRAISKELGVTIGVMQDLCGPKIRLGMLPEEGVRLLPDTEISLCGTTQDYSENTLPISYPTLHHEVQPGETILLADGFIELKVISVDGDKVRCNVMNGGVVFSRKGVNMPNTNLSIAVFTEKDRADLMMGLEEKVDYVAVSFIRNADDLRDVLDMIGKSEHKPKLIVKVEKTQAVDNIIEILERVDGIMVARGDLGVEAPLVTVPIQQKKLIEACRCAGKPVIIATQMLMSMVTNPRPTRGEVSDVARAVFEGADSIMLSDESASGKYPVEACKMLSQIAETTEPYVDYKNTLNEFACFDIKKPISKAVGRAATVVAEDVNAAVIVAFTESGFTAEAVARFRPKAPILALSSNESTCRALTLCWGVTPVHVDEYESIDEMFDCAVEYVLKKGLAQKGDKIVITAGLPIGVTGTTNLLRVIVI